MKRKALSTVAAAPEPDPDEGDVPLSEARGVYKRAHLLDEGRARGQQEPNVTRRNRGEQAQFPLRAPLAFRSVLGAPQMCDPNGHPPHLSDTWRAKRRKGSWLGGRGSDDQTNQLNQWRGGAIAGQTHSGRFVSRTSPANHGFSCTSARRALAELHSERARTATRTPSRAAIGRRWARMSACSR